MVDDKCLASRPNVSPVSKAKRVSQSWWNLDVVPICRRTIEVGGLVLPLYFYTSSLDRSRARQGKDTVWNSSGQESESIIHAYSQTSDLFPKPMGAHIVVEPWYPSPLPTAIFTPPPPPPPRQSVRVSWYEIILLFASLAYEMSSKFSCFDIRRLQPSLSERIYFIKDSYFTISPLCYSS
jgi:hypothetical protein